MSKHLADHRNVSNGGRVRNFLRLDRTAQVQNPRAWHRHRDAAGPLRLVHFLRIARGRTA
jgi:hypothetical protein